MAGQSCEQTNVLLECVGRFFRVLKDTDRDYDSSVVLNYIHRIGDVEYKEYGIVPRNIRISRKSLNRYSKFPHPYDAESEKYYRFAAQGLYQEFAVLKNSDVVSYDEAVFSLDPTKSPGYPWTLKYPTKGEYWLSDDSVWFDRFYSQLGTFNPPSIIHSCSVKEELRKIEKIQQENCRTMFAVDVNLITAQAMLFKRQADLFVSTHLQHCSALGLSLFNGGAQKLFEYLTPWGWIDNMFSIDGKQFDSNFTKLAMDLIYKFRFDMLDPQYQTPENELRCKNIARMLCEGYIIDIDGKVYGKLIGNPSGQFLTTADNIKKNFVDCFYIWCRSVPRQYRNWASFKKYVRILFVGDDIIMSVHPDFLQYYNYDSFMKWCGTIGMTYEFEFKEPRKWGELSFIGHTFVKRKVPGYPFEMWFPDIDCVKMRNAALHYNTHKGLVTEHENLVSIICGLRMETFACDSCRKWFAGLYDYVMSLYGHERNVKIASSGYKCDADMWKLFSGIQPWKTPPIDDWMYELPDNQ